MPDDDQGGRRWIVEPPPGPGQIALYLAVGDEAELTEQQQAALGDLLRTLESHEAEVIGHASCTDKDYPSCTHLSCSRVNCTGLWCLGLNKPCGIAGGLSSGWTLSGSFGQPI